MRIPNDGVVPADLVSTPISGSLSVTHQRPLQFELNEQESENVLLEFKTNMAEQFPFVVIHPDSTPGSLGQERPLLWNAIIAAASHGDSDRQMTFGANLVEDLTTRLLLMAEKSLDLLQALLILIAW